jgi:two-component system LytT family response regulator
MTKVRALIVDDEAVARRRIARLIGQRADVEVVAECSGGRAAVEAIEQLKPDLVFLDVQMPDLDGFAVLRDLDMGVLPAIVFVTAYDQYAVRAFEEAAVDYLLKPYSPDRFAQAVERAIRVIRGNGGASDDERVKTLLNELLQRTNAEEPAGRLDRFLVKRLGRAQFVRAQDVDWIEADGNYVRLHVGPQRFLVRATIASCAERLDPRKFVRIHRSFIVNMDRIKELEPWLGGDYVVLLDTGKKLRLSRHYREAFHSRMLGE